MLQTLNSGIKSWTGRGAADLMRTPTVLLSKIQSESFHAISIHAPPLKKEHVWRWSWGVGCFGPVDTVGHTTNGRLGAHHS